MKTDNELIAEFMGLAKSKDIWDQGQHAYTMKFPSVFNKMVVPSEMLFDCSWDWLMPVVEKIHKTLNEDEGLWRPGIDQTRNFLTLYITAPLPKVYKAVVEFIKWYNQQSR